MPDTAIAPECKVGVKYKSIIDPRSSQLQAGYTVRDVYDLMVELITNCDDSYRRLKKDKGLITIEHFEQRPNKKTLDRRVIVRDRAEGFDQLEMERKLRGYGSKTSENEDGYPQIRSRKSSGSIEAHQCDFGRQGKSVNPFFRHARLQSLLNLMCDRVRNFDTVKCISLM